MNNFNLDRLQTDSDFDLKQSMLDNEENVTPYLNIGHSCNYYTEDEFIDKTASISSKFSTYSHNIRSLPGKYSEFCNLIKSLNSNNFKFSIIALQEVWSIPTGTECKLNGYKPLEYKIRDPTCQNKNSGGGVGVFVDEKLEYELLHDLSVFEIGIFESQFLKVKISKNKFIIIGNIYRPNTAPLANIVRFNEILDNILVKIHSDPDLKKADDIQILGDFNIDLLKHQTHAHTMAYLDTLLSHKQLPLITLPTRITETSATLIDHISTSSQDNLYDAGIIHSSLSDHLPVFFIKNVKLNKEPPKYIKARKINSNTIPAFEKLLTSTSWDSVMKENRPDHSYSNFFDIIDNAVNLSFPEVTTKLNTDSTPLNPWMSQGLMISRKHKEKLFSKKIEESFRAKCESIQSLQYHIY